MKRGYNYTIIFFLLITGLIEVKGQNFIGMPKSAIPAALKTLHPEFKLDKSAVNHAYNYLKFVDKVSEQTLLFFLSEKEICTYVRWISDYSNLSDMTAMLNHNYHKSGANLWTYTDKGDDYSVTLTEGEWYFTVSFRKN
jgi:hypothetical protein